MNTIKDLFGIYKLTVRFYMKSGAVVKVRCDDITINKQGGNALTGYKMDRCDQGDCFYIRLDDVSAIQY